MRAAHIEWVDTGPQPLARSLSPAAKARFPLAPLGLADCRPALAAHNALVAGTHLSNPTRRLRAHLAA